MKSPKAKGQLHPRNPHVGRYDFAQLCQATPELKKFMVDNPKGDSTIDFADNDAVLCLNKALLAHYYQVRHWQIPPGYLCPPIPGRADYIHYAADLLAGNEEPPKGKKVKVLDIGTGANCIYPIIGSQTYGWQFVASDIDPVSVKVADVIVQSNLVLSKLVKVRLQNDPQSVFSNIIKPGEQFDLTLCNPPFYASLEEAKASNKRKQSNLNKGKKDKPVVSERNFGGQQAELWCEGGEIAFLSMMVEQSVDYAAQVKWFTSLVSKKQNIPPLKQQLHKLGAREVKVIDMAQGQKLSRLIAWRF